jgi:RNA polymerase-binding transcription factor DksA
MTASTKKTQTLGEESTLTRSQLAAFRRLLEAERETVLQRTEVFVADDDAIDRTSATSGQGETEHTTVDIERRVNRVLEAQARETLAEIDAALARVEDGTYGRCESCNTAIPTERLAAMPATRTCVTCRAKEDTRR